MAIREFFAQDGPLAKQFDRYESRAEQVSMAEAVAKAAESKQNLLVEAGTGVGKSIGYLAPIISIIRDNRIVHETEVQGDGTTKEIDRPRRVVISTGTINLQKQLFDKELPLLKKIFPWLTYAMAVGSENYLCGARLAKAMSEVATNPLLGADAAELEYLNAWSRTTATGLRMDLETPVSVATWSAVNRQSDLCRCRKWESNTPCFYRKARLEMNQANVILVNHHLLMAHLTIEAGTVLPAFDYVAIDEIHSLEEVATQCFGIEVSNYKIERFVKDGHRTIRSAGSDVTRADEIREYLDRIARSSDKLFLLIRQQLEVTRKDSLRLRKPIVNGIDQVELIEDLSKVATMMTAAADQVVDGQKAHEVRALADRAEDVSTQISGWLLQSESDHVYQIVSENGGKRLIAKSNPIDISPYLKGVLWDKEYPVIGTSATISTSGNMNFVKEKLGADDAVELVLASPFDYVNNAMIYLGHDLPEAKNGDDDTIYYNKMVERVCDLLKITNGRAMVLCTSNKAMKTLGQRLRPLLPGLRIMMQGEDLERHQMIEELRRNPRSVIIGVQSFWMGVDVSGDALQMVIIQKLPFPNVGDPLFEARCERVDAVRPGTFRSFNKISIPETIIKLKQGFGRLIRTASDYGVVAILDTRIISKRYGKTILDSLPRTYIKYNLTDVSEFFAHRQPPPEQPRAEESPIEEVPF